MAKRKVTAKAPSRPARPAAAPPRRAAKPPRKVARAAPRRAAMSRAAAKSSTRGKRMPSSPRVTGAARHWIVTPSQTVGPFFAVGFGPVPALPSADLPGERVTVTGQVRDGNGTAVPDCMVETWQANPRGKYAHPEDWQDKQTTPGFSGFGRMMTDPQGWFRLETLRPGAVPWPGTNPAAGAGPVQQAPHIVVCVFARGLLKHLFTRLYLRDDPLIAADPVLALVKPPARRETLVAQPVAGQPGHYRWDIVLQGTGETVFFDV